MKPIVWIDSTSYKDGTASLAKWARLVSPDSVLGQPWQLSLREVDAAVVTARYRFDSATMQQFPRLKIIARLGVGYDNVDIEAATRLGICVTITPDGSTQAVAEHTLAMMLALCRQIREADESVRTGNWNRRQQLMGPDLQSLTLGIVGLGRIGSRVAHMANSGFSMRVLAFDPYLSHETISNRGAEPCAMLSDLLTQADIISLHVPGNEETRHMLCHDTMALMKPGARLINTARGSIVDEADLADAIKTGHLSSAALDVFECEPPDQSSLLIYMPEVILSPHSAGLSTDSLRCIGIKAAEQVRRALDGLQPDHLVNPQVWENRRRSLIHD